MGRFDSIKKSRKKSKDIDEKIEYLNKECQKTGLCEIANSTSGLYSVLGNETNPKHNDFKGLNNDGAPFGFSGAVYNINAEPLDGFKYSPPHPVSGERRKASSWFGIASGFQPVVANSDREILWIFDQSLNSGFGNYFSLELTKGSSPFWGTWIDTAFGTSMLVPYNGVNSPLSNSIQTALNNLNINQFLNPEEFGPPTNPILFKNDLGDPTHLPIDINNLSPEGFNNLRNKAKDDEEILALFGFGTPKSKEPPVYGGARGKLFRDIKDFDKQSPLSGGPGGIFKLSHIPEGELLSEGVKLGHFQPEVLNVDINDIRKGIMPEFPKDSPPEMINGYSAKSRLAPKTVKGEPFIKITRKDLARNHKLTDKEISEFMIDIKMVNEYIKRHPEELIYVMTRYPKDDPRLAQLNFKMDQMKAASDQYMETHFPENQKLFNKLQQKISNTIGQTDPKNFKDPTPPPQFTDDLDTIKRRKKTVSRHFKKIKRKKG